jgi:2,3-bisphosphoglycerate-independent phosphoglycerate mutase
MSIPEKFATLYTMKNNHIPGPIVLIVLDGWGYRTDTSHNAIAAAHTPVFSKLWHSYPHTLLNASGEAVGLPEGQMGNSEIGHSTIGAGTVIDTELVRINKAAARGDFTTNPAMVAVFDHVKKYNSTLHVQGLVSDGGVHSLDKHLFAFIRAAAQVGVKKLAVHVFTDGRDTAPQSAATYVHQLEKVLAETGIGRIASLSGRFYAMDRDQNWDRVKKAEEAMFECKGNICTIRPSAYLEQAYTTGGLDEHLPPTVCLDEDGKGCAIAENDAIFFFNFRADRARMISERILAQSQAKNLCFATLTEYHPDFKCYVAFPPVTIETTLAAEVAKAGLTQTHIAETEKFPHATYFLNGGREKPWPLEEHVMLPSRKDVPTHDLAPKMRAEGIADKAIEAIRAGRRFIFINFANADMVGHTANVPAIIEAVEEVDKQLGRVIDALVAAHGAAFITADHGNAETNIDPITGAPHTSHTTNPVPAILVSEHGLITAAAPATKQTTAVLGDERVTGGLADIAPTILHLLALPQPKAMKGAILSALL